MSKNTLTVEVTNPALPIDALARSANKFRTSRYSTLWCLQPKACPELRPRLSETCSFPIPTVHSDGTCFRPGGRKDRLSHSSDRPSRDTPVLFMHRHSNVAPALQYKQHPLHAVNRKYSVSFMCLREAPLWRATASTFVEHGPANASAICAAGFRSGRRRARSGHRRVCTHGQASHLPAAAPAPDG